MKKLIFITIAVLLIHSTAISQWVIQDGGTTSILYHIEFVDLNTGWITGVNGIILKTTNAGTNWIMQTNNLVQQRILTCVSMVDANTGYISGRNSAIMKTTNGGVNWLVLREMPVGQGNNYHDVYFFNEQTGWISGDLGYVWKTTNAGFNWDSVNVGGNSYLFDIVFVNNQTGWVAGNSGFMCKTTNGGQNWLQQITGTTASFSYNSLCFIDSFTGWVAGTDNSVYKTTNSGNNWVMVSLTPGICLHFVNSLTGWTAGNNGDMYKSTNGGLNFYQQNTPVAAGFFTDIEFVNDTIGWAVDVYVILHTTDGGGEYVGINPLSNEVPAEFMLYQNYPNPFNPETKIKFQVSERNHVKLSIYDILGKEIEVLLDKHVTPGIYEVPWNASGFSSGVYFYRLSAGNRVQTNKMILIR